MTTVTPHVQPENSKKTVVYQGPMSESQEKALDALEAGPLTTKEVAELSELSYTGVRYALEQLRHMGGVCRKSRLWFVPKEPVAVDVIEMEAQLTPGLQSLIQTFKEHKGPLGGAEALRMSGASPGKNGRSWISWLCLSGYLLPAGGSTYVYAYPERLAPPKKEPENPKEAFRKKMAELATWGPKANARKVLVLDCETANAPPRKEDGSFDFQAFDVLGLSVCCIWSSWRGNVGEFEFYDSREGDDLARIIEEADVVASFNGKGFDIPLLEHVLKRPLTVKHHIDLSELVYLEAGHYISLDNLATTTLNDGKLQCGEAAPTMWKQGRFCELFSYCQKDVSLTMQLLQFAEKRGYLLFTDLDGKVKEVRVGARPDLPVTRKRFVYEPRGQMTSSQRHRIQEMYRSLGICDNWQPSGPISKTAASKEIQRLMRIEEKRRLCQDSSLTEEVKLR